MIKPGWELPRLEAGRAAAPQQSDPPKPKAWRPHMARRRGETVAQWQARLSWSCYACGRQFEQGQRQALNEHEAAHHGQ